jgi:adenylate kinase
MRVILLGAPGAGKGTQGALLAKRHGVERISTGELLRNAVRADSPLGHKARSFMDAGELVPDDVMLGLVREILAGEAHDGFVLDGFPRTLEQANGLRDIMAEVDTALDAVVVLKVENDVLLKRLSGRRSCPGCEAVYNVYFDPPTEASICDRCGSELKQRSDDDPETVMRRIQVYGDQTRPLVQYYEESGVPVVYIDGGRKVEVVQADIEGKLAPV